MTRELRRAIDYDKETVIEDADTAIVPRQLGYPFGKWLICIIYTSLNNSVIHLVSYLYVEQ